MLPPQSYRILSHSNKLISFSSSSFKTKLFNFRPFSSSQLTGFDERWKKLTQAEKDLVAKEYEHLQKGDWKSLTIDQKRIRNFNSISF